MNISDEITNLILEILENSHGTANIQRNELAMQIGCVPSAINYVITSRFTPQQGYIVESRRGGGGYIRITQISSDGTGVVMHIVNSLGEDLDERTCRIITENLLYRGIINSSTAKLIGAALSDKVLSDVSYEMREKIRAKIFKSMLMSVI